MSNGIALPFFRAQADGTQYADAYGVVREYDFEENALITKGVIKAPPLVGEAQDGQVYPQLFDRIRLVQQWRAALEACKLDGLPLAYFYLLHSSDDLLRFYPESRTRIRIEVDSGRLHQKILRNICVGGKGDEGPVGLDGRLGRPARREAKHRLHVQTPTTVTLTADVAIPLETPVSLRLYDADGLWAEIQIKTAADSAQGQFTSEAFSKTRLLDWVQTKIETDFYDHHVRVKAQLVLALGEFDDSCYAKIRQIGPTGEDGPDGLDFPLVQDQLLQDAHLGATAAVVNLRKSGISDDLLFLRQPVGTINCVQGLRAAPNLPGDAEKTYWAAALVTMLECKDVCVYRPELPLLDVPLNLLAWTPQKQCADRLRYEMTKFDWMSQTSKEQCGVLPFKIATDPRPPEQCCQQPMFTCFNQGDACPVEGTVPPIIRFEQETCPCDCTPAAELLQVDKEPVEKIYHCSLNDRTDVWQQEVEVSGPTHVRVSLALGDPCSNFPAGGGGGSGGSGGSCSFTTNVIPCCIGEGLTMDEAIQTIIGEGSLDLHLAGNGSCRLDVLVNLEKSRCCLNYALTIRAEPEAK